MNTLCINHFCPLLLLGLLSDSLHCFLFVYIHKHTLPKIYNILNPISVYSVCICLELTTWDWDLVPRIAGEGLRQEDYNEFKANLATM